MIKDGLVFILDTKCFTSSRVSLADITDMTFPH